MLPFMTVTIREKATLRLLAGGRGSERCGRLPRLAPGFGEKVLDPWCAPVLKGPRSFR